VLVEAVALEVDAPETAAPAELAPLELAAEGVYVSKGSVACALPCEAAPVTAVDDFGDADAVSAAFNCASRLEVAAPPEVTLEISIAFSNPSPKSALSIHRHPPQICSADISWPRSFGRTPGQTPYNGRRVTSE
jgi:sugar/nucleoside kinase (ribokinase family)